MRITSIRTKGQLPSTDIILNVERELRRRFAKAGYVTEVNAETRSAIKIGLHMRSFKLDLSKHDRNLRHAPGLPLKLTDVPTWDQRVEFNGIVNAVLNKFKLSANVKSGPFTIRKGTQVFTECDWLDQKPEWITYNECRGYYVEAVDEKAFVEERRITRLKAQREKRAQAKQREDQRPHLSLAGA